MASSLAGKRVVITRSAQQSASFCARIRALDGVPIVFPTIETVSLEAPQLDRALADIDHFDWLLFTSVNAVHFFCQRFVGHGLPCSSQPDHLPRIAAVGPVTADALRKQGLQPELIPSVNTGEELARSLGDLTGKEVLLPRARAGRPEIVDVLSALGATVYDIALYETVATNPSAEAMAEIAVGVDVLTFTSPSTAINFFEMVEPGAVASAVVACIGPTTADAVCALGVHVDVVPSSYTVSDMVDALADYFTHGNHSSRKPSMLEDSAIA